MAARIIFFPVGNGDMILVELDSGKKILIDVNIRISADDPDELVPDVVMMLKKQLKPDFLGRLYVDVLLLSHPDQDHCRGLSRHFHLGSPDTYSKADEKIFVREIWSSPIVFRRASKILTLSEDATSFCSEARRRVKYFRDNGLAAINDGDRIQIMGEDENGKTDDLALILVRVDDLVTKVNGVSDPSMAARLLGPLPKSDNEQEEEALAKNRSSVILNFDLKVAGVDVCRFLVGGDAEVAVWERLWRNYQYTDCLEYDILVTPHHCSWHSLSHDSWSEMGENAAVSKDAINALSQARPGACIVASSKSINANDSDPPCIGAKQQYEEIANTVGGHFKCVGEYPIKSSLNMMEFEIGQHGPRLKSKPVQAAVHSSGLVGRQPLAHG